VVSADRGSLLICHDYDDDGGDNGDNEDCGGGVENSGGGASMRSPVFAALLCMLSLFPLSLPSRHCFLSLLSPLALLALLHLKFPLPLLSSHSRALFALSALCPLCLLIYALYPTAVCSLSLLV
jgi:hypothetical protein